MASARRRREERFRLGLRGLYPVASASCSHGMAWSQIKRRGFCGMGDWYDSESKVDIYKASYAQGRAIMRSSIMESGRE